VEPPIQKPGSAPAIFYSCNMGTSDLPDMYSQSPRAAGIHIRQITHAHVTTIKCNTSKVDSLVANAGVITVSFIHPCLEDSIIVMQHNVVATIHIING